MDKVQYYGTDQVARRPGPEDPGRPLVGQHDPAILVYDNGIKGTGKKPTEPVLALAQSPFPPPILGNIVDRADGSRPALVGSETDLHADTDAGAAILSEQGEFIGFRYLPPPTRSWCRETTISRSSGAIRSLMRRPISSCSSYPIISEKARL